MTKQELNRNVKRLWKNTCNNRVEPTIKTLDEVLIIKDELKKEYTRLYNVDNTFESLTKQNIIYMIKMNLTYKAILPHIFGCNIEYKNN